MTNIILILLIKNRKWIIFIPIMSKIRCKNKKC